MTNPGVYLLQRTSHAAVAALICNLLAVLALPTAWLAAIIIALVTLRNGSKAGLYVLLWAALPAIIVAIKGYWLLFFSLVIFGNLLVWLLALILRETRSWATVLQIAAVLGVIAIAVVHGYMPNVQHWWAPQIVKYFSGLNQLFNLGLSAVRIHASALVLAKFATGLQVASVLLSAGFYLLMARWWQAKIYNPGGLRQEWRYIRMSRLAAIVMLLMLVAAVLKVAVAIDMLPVVLLPFAVTGLSLLHAVTGRKKGGVLLLIGCYGLLVVWFVYMLGLLVLAAFIDSWYDFRVRYSLI